MKSIITLLLLALFSVGLMSVTRLAADEPETAIKFFNGTYKEALAEAKKQNKLIFIDTYVYWCGPCKLLKQYTFANKVVGNYYNEHFINLAIDIDKGDGPEIAAKYKVNRFPTLIITDDEGKQITYTVGYIMPSDFLGFGQHAVKKAPGLKECAQD
jgi:thioredoxin 1